MTGRSEPKQKRGSTYALLGQQKYSKFSLLISIDMQANFYTDRDSFHENSHTILTVVVQQWTPQI